LASQVDIVLVVDVSPSMRKPYSDFRPSKLQVLKDALVYVGRRVLERSSGTKLGVVAFYGRAYPVLEPTSDIRAYIKSIAALRSGREGSAPGDGLIEAIKLLRRSIRRKMAIIATDGGFNEGIRLDHAALYARNSSVQVSVVTLGDEVSPSDRAVIEATTSGTGGQWLHASSKSELYKALLKVVGLEEVQPALL